MSEPNQLPLCNCFNNLSFNILYFSNSFILNVILLVILLTAKTETPTSSAELSTWFDVGGIVGAIVAGSVSDYFGKSACTCAAMLTLAVPTVSGILTQIYIIVNQLLNLIIFRDHVERKVPKYGNSYKKIKRSPDKRSTQITEA